MRLLTICSEIQGINTQHRDFQGRAVLGASFPSSQINSDGNGHGTHVAGIIGSATYGVAKKSTLIAVKVLSDSGSGYLSDVIAGIEWSVNNATASKRIGKSVMNLSLGSAKSQVVDDAVNAAVQAGMVRSPRKALIPSSLTLQTVRCSGGRQ